MARPRAPSALWPRPTSRTPARPCGFPPEGLDRDIAEALFGAVTTEDPAGGTPKVWQITESGSVSRLWLEEGKRTGAFPRLVQRDRFGDREYFVFADGMVLWRPNAREKFRRLMKAA